MQKAALATNYQRTPPQTTTTTFRFFKGRLSSHHLWVDVTKCGTHHLPIHIALCAVDTSPELARMKEIPQTLILIFIIFAAKTRIRRAKFSNRRANTSSQIGRVKAILVQ
jgi:hypothetical protein